MATRKTATAVASTGPIPAAWKVVKHRGKANEYLAEMAATSKPTPGGRVALTSKTGFVTNGTLIEAAPGTAAYKPTSEGLQVWHFERDRLTPAEQVAAKSARLQAQIAYNESPEGLATAERIAARLAAKAEKVAADVADGAKSANPDLAAQDRLNASNHQEQLPSLGDLIGANILAGMTPADAATAGIATLSSIADRLTAAAAPAKSVKTQGKVSAKSLPAKQSAAKLAASLSQSIDPTRAECDTCGQSRVLVETTNGTDFQVCNRCATLDTATMITRAARRGITPTAA